MIRICIVMLMSMFLVACYSSESTSNSPGFGDTGTGGSTAKFTIQNGYLITVEDDLISSYDLDNPLEPEKLATIHGRAVLETVFPFGDDLIFIGSQTGAAIVKVHDGSELTTGGYAEGEMEIVAQISHATSCDPVVANETHMYVTIRDGVGCGFFTDSNSLIIYDIEDLENPVELTTRDISRPEGLSLRNNELFVCYERGLKHYDVSDPSTPLEIGDYRSAECNDIIALQDSLIITSDEKVTQARIEDGALNVLSQILKEA